jgi:glycosyltransferase involved in cell wall biosynthesis
VQLREIRYRVEESQGGCWARAEALSLLRDEEYVLQIDAHMRFERGWDDLLIDTLQRCGAERAVLSTYVPAYHPPAILQDCAGAICLTHVDRFGDGSELQLIHLVGHLHPLDPARGAPVLGAFFTGNFLFAPSGVFREVPFDPYIHFRGQEPVYSARLWTHGYDIFHPDRTILYHYWDSKSRPNLGDKPHYKAHSAQAHTARLRVKHLLGLSPTEDKEALREIDRYGMGRVRSLEEFWEFSGVDFNKRTIADKARYGGYTPFVRHAAKNASFDFPASKGTMRAAYDWRKEDLE